MKNEGLACRVDREIRQGRKARAASQLNKVASLRHIGKNRVRKHRDGAHVKIDHSGHIGARKLTVVAEFAVARGVDEIFDLRLLSLQKLLYRFQPFIGRKVGRDDTAGVWQGGGKLFHRFAAAGNEPKSVYLPHA